MRRRSIFAKEYSVRKGFLRRAFSRLRFFGSSKNAFQRAFDPDEILVDSVSALHSETLEGKLERPLSPLSSFIFLSLIAAGFLYLFSRAGFLQVASGEVFFLKSQENRFLTRPIFPPRGILYDSSREPIVENIPSFGLIFEKSAFTKKRGAKIEDVVMRLSGLLKKDKEFLYEAGFPKSGSAKDLPSQFFVAHDLPLEEVVALAPHLDALPGIEIVESYRRAYKNPLADSHLIGALGKVSAADIEAHPELAAEESVGKTGIEAYYDPLLRGKGGKKIIEADSRGRETNFKYSEEPVEGLPLLLTIDEKLQKTAYDLLENYIGGRKGASVVIMDPRSGAVRSMVSYPGYDINLFSGSLTQKEFGMVMQNPLKPLFNRAIGGEFPSGSTFKPLVAAAALEERIIDPRKKIYDEGYIEIPNPYRPGEKSVFKDWRKQGWIDFYDAIAYSANVYFYMLGGGYGDQKGLGIQKIKEYAERFGLGKKTGIDISGEKAGLIPDPEYKKSASPNDPIWRIGDTYNTSIGQGGVKITPLQLTSAIAAIANGGTLYRPHVLDAVLDKEGNVTRKIEPEIMRDHVVGEAALREVVKGMAGTVTYGTARLLSDLPVSAAAKTGTAQTGGKGIPHAWVTAFAPVENPEIAITVMVEHAGEGSTVAAPITNEILKWYFAHRSQYP